MRRIRAAKIDDFTVTVDRGLFIFTAVMSEVTLHQPRLGTVWINLQDTVNENLGNFPTFFGDRTRCMRPVDADLRIVVVANQPGFTPKNRKGFHLFELRMSQLTDVVKRIDRFLIEKFSRFE
jgi:hypothetical protein